VALSTLLAVGGPQVVLRTVDGGARDAVTTAHERADVSVLIPVGDPAAAGTPVTRPEGFAALAADLPARLPAGLSQVLGDPVSSLVGPTAPLLAKDGVPDRTTDDDGEVHLQVALL